MLSYWFFFIASVIMLSSFLVQKGPASGGWTIYPPLSALPKAMPGSGMGMTLMANQYGAVCRILINGWYQLCKYHIKHAYKRYGPLENAFNCMGFIPYRYIRCIIIPCISCGCGIVNIRP
jgi:heme/copper-type cytochrome/quinol oxidase subunit 1